MVLILVCFLLKGLARNIETPLDLWSIFGFAFTKNYGMTYGIFENREIIIYSTNFSLLTIVIYMYYKAVKNTNSLYYISPWVLILSGATRNIADRLMNGYVTDYIKFNINHFTYFNLDDIFIIVGTALFIFQSFKNNKMIGRIFRFSGNNCWIA